MKIYVLNFGRSKKYLRTTSLILCAILLLSLFINIGVKHTAGVFNPVLTKDYSNTVVIDPGHGGEDPGAVGFGELYEKDLNLQIAKEIGELLKAQGIDVVYTREDDVMLYSESENIKGMRKLSDLKNRCKIANSYPGAVFVSVHMNSFGDSKYDGLQVYYQDGKDNSYTFAKNVQNAVKEKLQHDNNRNVKNGKNIYVLDNSKLDSILIECGFLSNSEECKKLSQKEYQKELSFSIVYGIIEYMKFKNS